MCVCSEINSWHLYILDTKVRLCLQLLSSKWHSDAPGPECPVADLWWLTAQTQRTKTAALCEVWPGDRQKSREQHSSTRLQLSSTSQRYEWTLTCGYTGYSFSSALSCNDIDCHDFWFSAVFHWTSHRHCISEIQVVGTKCKNFCFFWSACLHFRGLPVTMTKHRHRGGNISLWLMTSVSGIPLWSEVNIIRVWGRCQPLCTYQLLSPPRWEFILHQPHSWLLKGITGLTTQTSVRVSTAQHNQLYCEKTK